MTTSQLTQHPAGTSASVRPRTTPSGAPQPALLRLGALLGGIGVVMQIPMDRLHPHHAAPNDSAAAFAEYARSQHWTLVHVGQWFGMLLIVFGLLSLARGLARQRGIAGALGFLGAVTAVLVAAVFTVQMAVDGVALKGAIDTWATSTSPAQHVAAFQVADGIRWIEKACSAFFHLLNGATFVLLGLSVAVGRYCPRWLGVSGFLAGVGFVVTGLVTAHSGFSGQADAFVLPATLFGSVFLIGAFVSMWRRAGRERSV
jgi:hypothetical protein